MQVGHQLEGASHAQTQCMLAKSDAARASAGRGGNADESLVPANEVSDTETK